MPPIASSIDAPRYTMGRGASGRHIHSGAAVNGLENSGKGHLANQTLAANPDASDGQRALDALSGEIHASLHRAIVEDTVQDSSARSAPSHYPANAALPGAARQLRRDQKIHHLLSRYSDRPGNLLARAVSLKIQPLQ